MARKDPCKVLITGGHEVGGVHSFAVGLASGFNELGIPCEVISPSAILTRSRELRDRNILKILSTTAVFAAPFGRRVICVAHGFPRADNQGWPKFTAIIASFKLATFSNAKLVAVSAYSAVHLRAIFDVTVDAVIHNPLTQCFMDVPGHRTEPRNYITYVGRLHPSKNLHRLIPVIKDLLDQVPDLRACFIGDGEERESLEKMIEGNSRFEFSGILQAPAVRDWLRRTNVFISGCETEALGISYLEALSQGCSIVMPACGGGLEIAPHLVGKRIHLLPLSFEKSEMLSIIRRALRSDHEPMSFAAYHPKEVAAAYLKVDSQRDLRIAASDAETELGSELAKVR